MKSDICGECGAYIPPFCLLCNGFQTMRCGAITFCLECQDHTACPCHLLVDEDRVLTLPFHDIAWWLAGLPTDDEFPRAMTEEEAERVREANIDFADTESVSYFLSTGQVPPWLLDDEE